MPKVAFHPEESVTCTGGNRRAVMAEIMRAGADPGAGLLDRRPKADALQMAHAVRRQKHAGADFTERGRLLVDRDIEAAGDQRVRREQPADAAANDDNPEPLPLHLPVRPVLRPVQR